MGMDGSWKPRQAPRDRRSAGAATREDDGGRAVQLESLAQESGFAGLFPFDIHTYRSPIVAAATDGVGAKQEIAVKMGIYDTVGIDAAAMVADDVAATGAQPLFLLCRLRIGSMRSDDAGPIVSGVAKACDIVGCQLIDAAVAQPRGIGTDSDFDLSATGVGVVESDDLLGTHRVRVGDILIAMSSSGLHANGFGIILSTILRRGRARLDAVVEDLGSERTLGEVMLTPTRIYSPAILRFARECEVHAFAHVTGGGIRGNLLRVLPGFAGAVVDRGTWTPHPIFRYVAAHGRIGCEEMENSFNMGVGMIAVVPEAEADRGVAMLNGMGHTAWIVGEITPEEDRISMVGRHPDGF